MIAQAYGAVSFARGRQTFGLSERVSEPSASYRVCAEGVRIILPSGGLISDSEAKRLAWALLADLAPDEVVPVPDVVTYLEGQRLAVMRTLAEGERAIKEIASALGWPRRTVEKRLRELRADGRVLTTRYSAQDTKHRLAVVL